MRVTFTARLDRARIPIQIDVGFGDTVTPAPVESDYPTLVPAPHPRLLVYPKETVVAEKFEAIVQLGIANTRMKDAREPGETYAYNLNQICRILDSLSLLPKAVVATAAFAGLREGELRGLEWTDYRGDSLSVNRSIWKTFVNKPKTRASANPVPVIRQLAEILNTYRSSTGNPAAGVMFHSGGSEPMDLDKLAQLASVQS